MVANALAAFTLPGTWLISATAPGFVDLNLTFHFYAPIQVYQRPHSL